MRHVYKKVLTAFTISVVPTLKDNFSYLICDHATGTIAAVDVNADTSPLEKQLEIDGQWGAASKHSFAAILTTHRHHDHAGGNDKFVKAVKAAWGPTASPVEVYGGVKDAIPSVTHPVKQADRFAIGSLQVEVVDVPCHTRGHVAYHVSSGNSEEAALFTGDTLFVGGLGAFFEGSAADMCVAMRRLATVNEGKGTTDAKTFVFPGHEYTEGFIQFSINTYPTSAAGGTEEVQFFKEQLQRYRSMLSAGMPTVPSSLQEEKRQNLFMRALIDADFRKAMNKGAGEVELMEYLYNACD